MDGSGSGAIIATSAPIWRHVGPGGKVDATLARLIRANTNKLGGFSDACHSLTAATTVAIGKEEALIDEMEKILEGGKEER